MKKVNWLDHLANLLVVILGISIAFYLEGYRSEKANKRQENQYVTSLIEDLEADRIALDTLRKVNKMILSSTIGLANASVSNSYDRDSLIFHLRVVGYNPEFAPQVSIYESLKASGKMDLISDFELRKRIIELYEQYYTGANTYDEELTYNIRDFYKPFYVKNVEFIGANDVNPKFLGKSEFKNIIFNYRFLYEAKSNYYDFLSMEVDEVLEALRKYQVK